MNQIVLLSILLSGLVFGTSASSAEELGACRSFCSAEKQQCRSAAERLTNDDTTQPMLSMEEKNPLVRNFNPPSAGTEQIQPGRSDAFRNRRMARIHTCEDTYLRCARACSSAPKSDILLKPEPKYSQ